MALEKSIEKFYNRSLLGLQDENKKILVWLRMGKITTL